MSVLLWRNVFLSLHVFSFMILSTSAVAGAAVHRMLWQAVESAPPQVPPLAKLSRGMGLCGAVGGLLMGLTGIGLLGATHWVYWGAPWLSIKLGIYVALALMGSLIAKPAGEKLQVLLPAYSAKHPGAAVAVALDPELLTLRQRMARFHVVHGVLFAAVVLLAVFKP